MITVKEIDRTILAGMKPNRFRICYIDEIRRKDALDLVDTMMSVSRAINTDVTGMLSRMVGPVVISEIIDE